jgi:hypothetical protein
MRDVTGDPVVRQATLNVGEVREAMDALAELFYRYLQPAYGHHPGHAHTDLAARHVRGVPPALDA